ncbi:MAG: ammonia channel protein, partial [Rubrivivax sp.]
MKKLLASLALGAAALGLLGSVAPAAWAQAPAASASAPAAEASAPAAAASAAAEAPAPAASAAAAPAPVPNKGDTAFMTIATALVILMTIPGLALFYGGLVRSK